MTTAADNRIRKNVLRLLCVSVLAGILVAGLWPFHAPRNDVAWLNDGNGLRFGRHGVMLSSETDDLAGLKGENELQP